MRIQQQTRRLIICRRNGKCFTIPIFEFHKMVKIVFIYNGIPPSDYHGKRTFKYKVSNLNSTGKSSLHLTQDQRNDIIPRLSPITQIWNYTLIFCFSNCDFCVDPTAIKIHLLNLNSKICYTNIFQLFITHSSRYSCRFSYSKSAKMLN